MFESGLIEWDVKFMYSSKMLKFILDPKKKKKSSSEYSLGKELTFVHEFMA